MDSFPEAVAVLQAQLGRYHKLLTMLDVERKAIEGDDVERLQGVVALKQPLIDDIRADADRLYPFAAAVAQQAAADGAAVRYAEHNQQLTALMQETVRQQNANQALLEARMREVRGKLGSMQQGRTMLSAYGNALKGRPLSHVPRFVDHQR